MPPCGGCAHLLRTHCGRVPRRLPDALKARASTRSESSIAVVGVAGFKPTASSSRTKRATKLRHTPLEATTAYRTDPAIRQSGLRYRGAQTCLGIGAASALCSSHPALSGDLH